MIFFELISPSHECRDAMSNKNIRLKSSSFDILDDVHRILKLYRPLSQTVIINVDKKFDIKILLDLTSVLQRTCDLNFTKASGMLEVSNLSGTAITCAA